MTKPLLVQIPYSHNCVKVRRALTLKGIAFDTLDVAPADRAPVLRASGQRLVPALVHDGRAIADSTEILLYLEEAWPGERPLVPRDPAARAECLLLEDWADAAFMALTRRLAYWSIFQQPGRLASLFFPEAKGLSARIRERIARRLVAKRFHMSAAQIARDEAEAPRLAALAVNRLGGRPHLLDCGLTIADVGLASMTYPLGAAAPAVREDAAVVSLLAWGRTILEDPA